MLTLKIRTDNAAFEDDRKAELARILRDAADRIERNVDASGLFDINGNNVGSFKLTGPPSRKESGFVRGGMIHPSAF